MTQWVMIRQMYVRTLEEFYVNRRWGHTRVRRVDVYVCDECETEHRTSYKASHADPAILTFCSKTCSKKSRSAGRLAQKWKQTKLERYGVEHSSQVSGAGGKMILTRVKRTGARAPSDPASSSNAQFRQTMLERHGVEYPLQSPTIRAKVQANTHEWKTSAAERELCVWLVNVFGESHVKRQQRIQNMVIDAYLPTLGLYVELDGCFFHGLLGPARATSKTVQQKLARDRRLVKWFENQQDVKLFRLSDLQWSELTQRHTYSMLFEQLRGVVGLVTYFDHAPGYNLPQDNGVWQ